MTRPTGLTVLPMAFVLFLQPGASAEEDGLAPAHYVVFEIDDSGFVQPFAHRLVRLSSPRPTLSEAEVEARVSAVPAEDETVVVRLLAPGGAVVYRDLVRVPRWLRIEPRPGDSHEDAPGHDFVVPARDRAFVVRVPVVGASRLRLSLHARETEYADGPTSDVEFDLESLATDPSLPLRRFLPETTVSAADSGSGNRVDLLVVGDGFTAAQSGAFQAAAANAIDDFFAIAPYGSYRSHFLTASLFTPSAQSGADHPTYDPACTIPRLCCSDIAGRPDQDPLSGTFVATAFDATFCAVPSIHRLLQVSTAKVLTAAAAHPDWDVILAVVNDATYGGSGGTISTVSTNQYAAEVARHEFGHGFTRLADEYATPFPGYPSCSDRGAPACEANATDVVDRLLLKWAPWVLSSTPIPTPDDSSMDSVVGLFEGARYQDTGMYRPSRSCLMRVLGVGFCPVCAQAFVSRLYGGGWGIPAGGIDPIEPGSESPAPGTVAVSYPESRAFSVGLLQPSGGPPLSVTWLVDGVPQPAAASGRFDFAPPRPGRFSLSVVVVDLTPFVHPALRSPSFWRSRSWTVDVGWAADLSVTGRASGEARDGEVFGYTVVAANAGPGATSAAVTVVHPQQLGGATWTCVATPGSGCPVAGTGNVDAAIALAAAGSATFTVAGTVAAGAARHLVSVAQVAGPPGFTDLDPANDRAALTIPVFRALGFHTLPPCRVLDTRANQGPALAAGMTRTFTAAGQCDIPATAWALSLNVTATQSTGPGHLRLTAGGIPTPQSSTVNYTAGQTRANNAVVPLNADGQFDVFCGQAAGSVHLVVDVNGYFE